MQKRTRAIAVTASMTVAGIALGATIASAANSSSTKPPALQSTGSRYVFACVNPGGGIDYLEFRAPLPHQCWFAGESLWYWDAVPLAAGGTTPTPTFSPTPTVSPTPSPTPSLVSPAKLAFTIQPSSGQNVPTTSTFNVAVAIEDSNGNTVTSGTGSTDTVTLAIGANPPAAGVLSCTDTGGLTVAAVAGVANFTGCSITVAGTGYKLTASDPTHTTVTAPANANSFNITAAAT